MTAEEKELRICSAHEKLMEEIAGMRADFRWFLRIGTGIFGLCGLVTTLITPTIVSINKDIQAVKQDILLLQQENKLRIETDKRIILQRNYDHKEQAPLQ